MKKEIKYLRIKIDGLAKLTTKLKPRRNFKMNLAMIPEGMSVEEVLTSYMETGVYIYESERKGKADPKLALPVEELPTIYKEIEKAADSLYLAKAWLGKILGELGEDTPYKNDGNRKTVEDIEPTADEDKGNNTLVGYNHLMFLADWKEKSHIEKVDHLREEIQKLIDGTYDFCDSYPEIELEQSFVYKYLTEAKMWLGFELQRIRKVEL